MSAIRYILRAPLAYLLPPSVWLLSAAGCTPVWYEDADNDTYGNPEVFVYADEAPEGYVGKPGDCDDMNSHVNPGATDVCNGIDDNCTGAPDDDAINKFAVSPDGDGDGYGDPAIVNLDADPLCRQ